MFPVTELLEHALNDLMKAMAAEDSGAGDLVTKSSLTLAEAGGRWASPG